MANDSSGTSREAGRAAEPVEASESLHPLAVALRSAVSLAFASGLSPDEVSDIVADVEAGRAASRASAADESAGTLHAAGELTQHWSTEAEFLDNGHPRVLPLKGRKGSFAALARRTGAFKNATEALELLTRHGAAESDGKTVKLKTRIVIANWATPEARARAWMSAVAHLNTLNLNASDRPKYEKRPERTAINMDFPASAMPALRDKVEEHGDAFLLVLDQFMREHAELARRAASQPRPLASDSWNSTCRASRRTSSRLPHASGDRRPVSPEPEPGGAR